MQITLKESSAIKRVLLALGAGSHQICSDDVRESLEEVLGLLTGEIEQCALACEELHADWAVGDDSGPLHCARAIRRRGREIIGKDNEKQGENHE